MYLRFAHDLHPTSRKPTVADLHTHATAYQNASIRKAFSPAAADDGMDHVLSLRCDDTSTGRQPASLSRSTFQFQKHTCSRPPSFHATRAFADTVVAGSAPLSVQISHTPPMTCIASTLTAVPPMGFTHVSAAVALPHFLHTSSTPNVECTE
ncbi:MAG: hypothetical protein Q9224_000812 [Gallowayella concinna]